MAELEATVNQETPENTNQTEPSEKANESAEIARLKAELLKAANKNDALAKENAEKTKQLRAKQSAEEVAAEEAKALQDAMQEELKQLRKEKAVGLITAKVMGFIGDNDMSTEIAEFLYGAEDADAALTAIQKAWTAKEKALRLEYGKIPAPGVGSGDGPSVTKEQLDAMKFVERVKFANEHPDEYNKIMGR